MAYAKIKLKISEIFDSIQGEGINAGKPSIFLRTSLCNLACSWCDTKYTWDWKNYDYKKEVKEMSTDEVRKEIKKYTGNRLVITGGEPLLQQDGLTELLGKLPGYFVEVETNCTIKPCEEILKYVNQWNVSPKLSNSRNRPALYENDECYRFFGQLNNSFFKYVIEDQRDIEEVEYFIHKYNLPREMVLLMPQATNKKELSFRDPIVKRLSDLHQVGFSSRLQVEMWSNQRGK